MISMQHSYIKYGVKGDIYTLSKLAGFLGSIATIPTTADEFICGEPRITFHPA
jgi:hypothetical protein